MTSFVRVLVLKYMYEEMLKDRFLKNKAVEIPYVVAVLDVLTFGWHSGRWKLTQICTKDDMKNSEYSLESVLVVFTVLLSQIEIETIQITVPLKSKLTVTHVSILEMDRYG